MDNAIVLIPTACRDSQIGIGLSKFGGNPDLPIDFSLDFDFQYFVGQINFAQINHAGAIPPLPEQGLLSLFLSGLPNDSLVVEAPYFASAEQLQRNLLPPRKHPCHPCLLTPHSFQSIKADCVTPDAYQLYEQQFLRRFYPHKQNFEFDTPWHQMLGFHRNLAQTRPTSDEDDNRILLLQIDSDSLVSMTWGYNGQLYFWIERSALEAKNFHDLKVELAQAQKIS
jgi:uncharacterized protein YwqG